MSWRPIETAPRDGTRVLLYDPQSSPKEMIGRHNPGCVGWWSDPTPSGRCIVWRDETGCSWMPLPPPPEGATP